VEPGQRRRWSWFLPPGPAVEEAGDGRLGGHRASWESRPLVMCEKPKEDGGGPPAGEIAIRSAGEHVSGSRPRKRSFFGAQAGEQENAERKLTASDFSCDHSAEGKLDEVKWARPRGNGDASRRRKKTREDEKSSNGSPQPDGIARLHLTRREVGGRQGERQVSRHRSTVKM